MRHHSIVCRLGVSDTETVRPSRADSHVTEVSFVDGDHRLGFGLGHALDQLRTLLIPQGSRLIGQYDAQVAFGQSRALLVWNRIIFPNGRSIVLERQPGADVAGLAGLQDGVDNHWGQIFRAALVSTLLSVGTEAGSGDDESELLRAIRRGSSDSISQTGQQIVGRSLDVQPTLTIRPGFLVRVVVTRDLVLEPYSG